MLALIFLCALAAFLVGLSKGGLPTVGTLAVPLLSFVLPPASGAALLLPIFIVSDLVGLWLYRRDYSGRNLAILVPAGILGVGLGWMFNSRLSGEAIGFVVGVVGLLFCLNSWFGARFRKAEATADVGKGIFWGGVAGLTSFVSHSGGPAFQMYVLPQRLAKMTFAGTSTILFAIINVAKVVPYWELGLYRHSDPTWFLWLTPPALVGTVLGRKLTRVLPTGVFFRLVEVTLLVLSLKLVFDYVSPII